MLCSLCIHILIYTHSIWNMCLCHLQFGRKEKQVSSVWLTRHRSKPKSPKGHSGSRCLNIRLGHPVEFHWNFGAKKNRDVSGLKPGENSTLHCQHIPMYHPYFPVSHLVGGLEHFLFPYIGNNHPNWLIFFRGVQTTNQSLYVEGAF